MRVQLLSMIKKETKDKYARKRTHSPKRTRLPPLLLCHSLFMHPIINSVAGESVEERGGGGGPSMSMYLCMHCIHGHSVHFSDASVAFPAVRRRGRSSTASVEATAQTPAAGGRGGNTSAVPPATRREYPMARRVANHQPTAQSAS